MATGMRRTFLAPLVMLQERSEKGRQSLLSADAKQSYLDSLSLNSMKAGSLEQENERLRKLIGLGSRIRTGFVPAEALHGRGIRDETTVILSAGSRAGVTRLSPVIAEQNRMLLVEADVRNNGKLRPGSFAHAEIVTNDAKMAVTVPNNAIVTFAGIEKVIVVQNGKALERPITTGRRSTEFTEIVAGISVGEKVIVDPGNLQSGQPVEVVE